MLTRENLFSSMITLGFEEPSKQTNKKVQRLNHTNLAYAVYVKPLEEQSLNTKYVLAIHPHYLIPKFESLDLLSKRKLLKEWQVRLKPMGIYLNENIESKTSFVGFPINESGSGQATTLNFENHPAVVTFCKIILDLEVSKNSEITPEKTSDFSESEDMFVSEQESNLPPTELNALVKVRLGQSKFRQDLWKHWQGCSVTGCDNDSLLIASHIIPWSENTKSRLDPFNGLLLSPTLDRAFDKGLISFDDSGLIMISPKLSKDTLDQLGISSSMKL
ncbi:HNH endonuclease [Acinetobacter sp. YH01005]|uniref:HNH endonuclease n=1 Tax=Acinetobacter sp. YH01005 TaxID=2601021 RepID=UPI0015D11CBC|nr:HNH endonuclease signature motif containing protein [Acinetobacter sp. YH01005]